VAEQWWPALKAVMDAENNVPAALSAIEKIQQATCTLHTSAVNTQAPQVEQTEQELMESVEELKRQNCIHGDLFTLEELVDPSDEKEIGKDLLVCNNEEIVKVLNKSIMKRRDWAVQLQMTNQILMSKQKKLTWDAKQQSRSARNLRIVVWM
jgi:hypothetical protein